MPPSAVLDRRLFLRVGLSAFALPLVAANTRAGTPGFGRARSVLLIFTGGGQSQLDTWDPKPDAPVEIRGDFRAVRTSVPGTLVCEHLPRLARLAHRFTLVRHVSHDDTDHGSACYLALTGHFHPRKSSNPPPRPSDEPNVGALLHRLQPATTFPYTSAEVNGPLLVPEEPSPGLDAGFLGRGCDPLLVGDPTAPVLVEGLTPLPTLPADRLAGRRHLLAALDTRPGTERERDAALLRQRAYDLLATPQVRSAFDLTQEPLALRERYGLFRAGQGCLLGRRLVEAGVPWVTVFWNHGIRGQDHTPEVADNFGWDTHNDLFASLRNPLLPTFDQSFAALLEDMEQRGLLDTTLLVCMGEFGRAPRVAVERSFAGSSPGRKHWAGVYTILLAGAGVARGGVVGASDRQGAYPRGEAVGPWDVTATMLAALGVDPTATYTDPAGRVLPRTRGRVIAGVYG